MDKSLLQGVLIHWRDLCKSRGRSLRSLREPFEAWHSLTKRDKDLRACERNVRKVIRAQRIRCILEKCLIETGRRQLLVALQIARSMNEYGSSAAVPFTDQVDRLLEQFEHPERGLPPYEDVDESNFHKLNIRGQTISLTSEHVECLLPLKTLHYHMIRQSGNPTPTDTTPHLLELIALAKSVERALNRKTPEQGMLWKRHFLSQDDDDPLFSTIDEDSIFSSFNDDKLNDLPSSKDSLLDADKENQSLAFSSELMTIQDNDFSFKSKTAARDMPLIDSIAYIAKRNLHVMKLDVNKSIQDVRSNEILLANYNEFIEKKKRQRIQCLRDLKEHCCTCRGPHISKPPFSHGKDYRREPTHEQCQRNECTFLGKKRKELAWLDETLGKYSNNEERFKREIVDCQEETQRRKAHMKDALADSLRLMEMAIN